MKISLKDTVKVLLYNVVSYAKPIVENTLSFWRRSLSRVETIAFLQDSVVYEQQDQLIEVPAYAISKEKSLSVNAFRSPEYMETPYIDYEKEYVWRLSRGGSVNKLSLCSSGTTLVNDRVLLNLDFGTTSGYRDLPFKQNRLHFPVVIAPWSHMAQLGYYDFLFAILTKFCLVEKVLGSDTLAKTKSCYPLVNTQFEAEYLSKLGIDRSNLIDTRSRTRITADAVILANNQGCFGRISPSNISLLRQRFLPTEPAASQRKLFILRKHTRRVSNQDEVIGLVSQYGFEIIPDSYRTVDEQIQLFRQAAVILAPHGAALANLVWCSPGTEVIEFFNGNYSPPYYYYLCHILNLQYDCLIDYTKGYGTYMPYKTDDIHVDLDVLKKKLARIFA